MIYIYMRPNVSLQETKYVLLWLGLTGGQHSPQWVNRPQSNRKTSVKWPVPVILSLTQKPQPVNKKKQQCTAVQCGHDISAGTHLNAAFIFAFLSLSIVTIASQHENLNPRFKKVKRKSKLNINMHYPDDICLRAFEPVLPDHMRGVSWFRWRHRC